MRRWAWLLRRSPQRRIIEDQLNVDDTAKLNNVLEETFIQPLHHVEL